MTDVPRRVEPSGADKVAVIADRAAPGSLAGATQWHRPQTVKTPTPQNAPNGDVGARLIVTQSIPVASLSGTSGQYQLLFADWTVQTDEGGSVITLGPRSGYDGIYMFEPGLYVMNLTVYPGIHGASASMMLQLGCNSSELGDTPTATWHGDDEVTGSTPFASGSMTNYFDGLGLSGGIYPYLLYKNIDPGVVFVIATFGVMKLT